jgi:hypothetical protein
VFFHYNSGKNGGREMISTFLDFFRRGLQPTNQESASIGGPAHFVTYGGDCLVDNNNALTTMTSALKIGKVLVHPE